MLTDQAFQAQAQLPVTVTPPYMRHFTRRRIAPGLRKLRDKPLENPWKKHDNIPH